MTYRILQNYLDYCNSSHELLTQTNSILLQQERNISSILQTQGYFSNSLNRNNNTNVANNTNTTNNTNLFSRRRNIRSFRDIGDISRISRSDRYLYTIPLQWNLNNFLSPVPVIPSEEQISNATETILYSTIIEPSYTSCPISYEDFNRDSNVMRILHCGHYFEPNSLRTWFRNNVRCPICRYDIRNYNLNNTSTNNTEINNETNNEENNDESYNDNISETENTTTSTTTIRNTNMNNSNNLIQTFMTSIQDELNNLLQGNDSSNNLISLEFLIE